jgi:hypothetical protein
LYFLITIPTLPALARGAFTLVIAEIIPDNLIRIIPAEGCTAFIRVVTVFPAVHFNKKPCFFATFEQRIARFLIL